MNWDIISQINNSFITSNLNFLISDDHIEKVKNILTQVDDRAEKLEIPNNNVKPIGVFETANYQKSEEDEEESLVIKHSYIFQIDFPYKWEKVIRKMKQNLIVQLLSCIDFEDIYTNIDDICLLEVRIEAIPNDESLIVVVVEFIDENYK